jgi:hypothetical protein
MKPGNRCKLYSWSGSCSKHIDRLLCEDLQVPLRRCSVVREVIIMILSRRIVQSWHSKTAWTPPRNQRKPSHPVPELETHRPQLSCRDNTPKHDTYRLFVAMWWLVRCDGWYQKNSKRKHKGALDHREDKSVAETSLRRERVKAHQSAYVKLTENRWEVRALPKR